MGEKILLIQLRQLGDILLTTPCLREIKRERPNAHVTFFSHKMGRLILEDNPYLDEHFTYDESMSLSSRWRLARSLRERHFDLVIDFMNNPRSAMHTWFSGASRRVAFRTARSWAYTDLVPLDHASTEYVVREKFKILRGAGFGPRSEALVLPWFEKHCGPLLRLIGKEAAFAQAPVRVALSPTHRRQMRQWPLERYALLADRLVEEWNAAVIWLWGPGEEALVDTAIAHCQQRTFKAPSTSFHEMAALIANVDLFVGNSNGPSHVAVATDICSLQLHGHTLASSWCPMSERHRAVQSSEYGVCAQPSMGAISLEEVWQALEDMRPLVLTTSPRRKELRLHWQA